MLTGFSRISTIVVSDVGQIGAGSTVEFLPSVRKVKIRRPRNARPHDEIVAARVCGDSLIGDYIFDGDRVHCRTNFEMSEVTPGRLVVARLPCGALTLKHFHLFDDGLNLRVRLEAANPAYAPREFDLDEIEVKALVVESVRIWE